MAHGQPNVGEGKIESTMQSNHKNYLPWVIATAVLFFLLTVGLGILSSNLILPDPMKVYVLPLLVIFIALGALVTGIQAFLQFRQSADRFSEIEERRYREQVLSKVHRFWIRDVFEQSLDGAPPIILELHTQPNALLQPELFDLQLTWQPPHILPPGTNIYQVYKGAEENLLILGEPGSGKTNLLLETASILLNDAQQNQHSRLPVVLNLSSWAVKRLPISRWIAEEMHTLYKVPRALGQVWIDRNSIIPLLDGLDEMPPEVLAECIEAINTYRQTHREVPMVVCSRYGEYFGQNNRLLLNQAINIQPLTWEQINRYVVMRGVNFIGVQRALHEDQELRELARVPFMLKILLDTYHEKPAAALPRMGTVEERRRQVMFDYVEMRFQPQGVNSSRAIEETTRPLSRIAGLLLQQRQTLFSLYYMKQDWIEKKLLRWLYRFSVMEILCALSLAFVGGLVAQRVGLLAGLFTGIVLGALNTFAKLGRTPRKWFWVGMKVFLFSIIGGLTFARCDIFVRQWLGATTLDLGDIGLSSTNLSALVVTDSIFFGCIAGIFGGMVNRLTIEPALSIRAVEKVVFSMKKAVPIFIKFLLLGLGSGLVIGLLVALLRMSLVSMRGGLELGLLFGSSFGVFFALFKGWSEKEYAENSPVSPTQGIRNSLRNLMLVGGVVFIVVGSMVGLLWGLAWFLVTSDISIALYLGLFFGGCGGLFAAFILGLFNGGDACIKYAVLRLLLWRYKVIPWNFLTFLEYSTREAGLYRIGSGYIFIHRLLLEYLASISASLPVV